MPITAEHASTSMENKIQILLTNNSSRSNECTLKNNNKYDSRRDANWEHFDDVILYIRLGYDILKTLINSFTVCYGVYTIFFGSYSGKGGYTV
jgi:hypothetical protein